MTIYSVRDYLGQELWWTTGRKAAHEWARKYAETKGRAVDVYLVSHKQTYWAGPTE